MICNRASLLLINPWVYDFTAYDFWSKPLGLLYIASILRDQGYHIDYIDCMDRYDPDLLELENYDPGKKNQDGTGPFLKQNLPKPEILKHIPRNYSRYGITEEIFLKKLKKKNKPAAVLVTSIMSYWYPGVFKAIQIIKEEYPDCPVILGGIYATLCYKHAVQYSGANYIITQSKTKELTYLLDFICQKESSHKTESDRLESIEQFPYPAWDLYEKIDYVSLITSRGCPFQCSYCASNLLHSHLEFRSPTGIVHEIQHWYSFKGIRQFVFYDDALLAHADSHFVPLMKELKKEKLDLVFHTPNALHAGYITRQIADLMFENHFKNIWLGFETSDHELQRKTGGKIDNSQFERTVRYLFKSGFSPSQIRAYVLVGIPGQSIQSILESIQWVAETGIKPYLTKFSPIPGTKIWKETIDAYQLSEPVDPLLHNDALMPYHSPVIHSQQYHQLKYLTQQINKRIK